MASSIVRQVLRRASTRARTVSMSAVVLVAVATFTGASARLGAETLLQQLGGAPQSANGALPDPSSRMVVLLFDLGGLSADDTRRAVDASAKFVESAAPSDRVAIVTMSTKLRVVTDFTADHAVLTALLQSPELLQPAAGGLIEQPDADTRLRAITTVCQTIAPIQERKAMLYFSGAAVGRDAVDQAELNNATNACRRGNVQIYPVDARGLAPLATAPQR